MAHFRLFLKQNVFWISAFDTDYPESVDFKNFANQGQKWWTDYVELVVARYQSKVKHWITIQDPFNLLYKGHVLGSRAPGLKIQDFNTYNVAYNLLWAHGLAADRIKSIDPSSKVSIALYQARWQPETSESDDLIFKSHDFSFNLFAEPIFRGQFPESMTDLIKDISGIKSLVQKSVDFLTYIPSTKTYSVKSCGNCENFNTKFERDWGVVITPETGEIEYMVVVRKCQENGWKWHEWPKNGQNYCFYHKSGISASKSYTSG